MSNCTESNGLNPSPSNIACHDFQLSPPWSLIFIYTIWLLYLSGNKLIFHQEIPLINYELIQFIIFSIY